MTGTEPGARLPDALRAPSGAPVLSWLGGLLTPLSWPYAAVVRRKRARVKGVRVSVPVVSVGNLTCGGTGKTPTVERLVRDLLQRAWRPAILSRGYGASHPKKANAGAVAVNDEYDVLATNLPETLHVQGADRVAAARRAIDAGADVLVLDDGFQHLRLARDLDIVLLDALRPFDNGRLLPAGLLREPIDSLAAADLLCITRTELVDDATLARLEEYLTARFPSTPHCRMATEMRRLVDIVSGEIVPDPPRRIAAFAAIGNPDGFRRSLERHGCEVMAFLAFPDHRRYTPRDIERVARAARAARAEAVLTTQKDAVKLRGEAFLGVLEEGRWLSMEIAQQITSGREAWEACLDALRNVSDVGAPTGEGEH